MALEFDAYFVNSNRSFEAGFDTGSAAPIQHVQENGVELPIVDKTVNVIVPTTVSELANDAGYVTADEVVGVVTITDNATTMDDIKGMDATKVVFDVSALNAGMYLCTMFLSGAYYRISDLITGFEATGFYQSSDLLKDIIAAGAQSTGKHYTVQWDQVQNVGSRLNDAAGITTDTTHFAHRGSVDANYSNPFDDIYPWSGRKLCNIDIGLYRGLTAGDDLTDCVVAWEDDVTFDYDHQYGVWVYTPPFFGRSYILGDYRYFDVTDVKTQNNISYKASLNGRWLGCDVVLTIDGAGKHCNLPKTGMSMANVTLANMHTYAKNYGASLTSIYDIDASALLFFVEYAGFNIQDKIGQGVASLYDQGLHLSANVSNNNVVTIATNANIIPGAIIDIGTSDGGNQIARTSVVSVNGTTVTLADSVTATTAHYVSVHGLINVADADIGSKSGFIGTNGKSTAYYRGEELYANKYQYILGAFRQTGTGAIWYAGEEDLDIYDALNTSVHHDSGLALPTSSGYAKTMGMISSASFVPFATETGGSSSAPYGDYVYVPTLATANTVLLFGGSTNHGTYCGIYGNWVYTDLNSHWTFGSRPHLKHP